MLPINKMISNYNNSARSSAIEYIIIHDVGAVSSAKDNATYFNGGNRNASADFFVDSSSIYQVVDYNNGRYSWAVGDGKGRYGITNNNSVSIEMCLESNYQPSEATINNTIDLVKHLMNELKLGEERVLRHYDASRKSCPNSLKANGWSKWNEFKSRLLGQDVPITPPPTVEPNTDSVFEKAKRYNAPKCRELQTKLNKVGYNCGTPDNSYGPKTHSALGRFQSDFGLTVDYLAGTNTFNRLNQRILELNPPKPQPQGNDWVRRLQQELNVQGYKDMYGNQLKVDGWLGDKTISAFPNLNKGARGNLTRLVQELLVAKGYNPNGIDGKYGDGTVEAVKKYQRDRKISSDGSFGKQSLRVAF